MFLPVQTVAMHRIYFTATASISKRPFNGSSATAMQERDGKKSVKYWP